MSDFLHFLNTADVESLTALSGVSATLARNLMEARPFDSIEDCLKVHGMGKNLLARAQASFEEADIIREEHALIPVQGQDTLEENKLEKRTPMEKIPTAETETKPTFGSRLNQAVLWFFRALLRLILIVLVIGGAGAAIYYGAPLINDKFVAPVEQNAARVSKLEDEVASLQTQLTEINNQVASVNAQLSETNSRIDEVNQSVEAHTASLEALVGMQATLDAKLDAANDKTLLALKNEVMMTRVLDMLSRARLYLAQSNFGLARNDVQSARDLLAELQSNSEDEILSQAVSRLDMALSDLPDFPVVASGDLEIAWQILTTGKAAATPTPESTPTPTATPEATLETAPSATPTP